MSSIRRFLVAPALVRLIRKERGGTRITEGHFAPQGGRNSYVRVDGQVCQLVLVNGGVEERTDVPRAHGDALLDVCPGKAAYDRTVLQAAGREVRIDRYVTPGSLDLLSVAFDSADEAGAFQPPAWFGRDVTGEGAYERATLAIQGVPAGEEVALSNAALDAVLDLIEPRFGFGRYGSAARGSEGGEGLAQPRRAVPPAPPPPAPEPVQAAQAEPEPAPQPAPEPAPAEAAAPEPVHHEAAQPGTPSATPAEAVHGDARIDDVIESLSQALGAAIQQQPEPGQPKGDDAPAFERWTVRPRRTQQT
ncbi:hypothetical protein Q8W71_07100 [Methylobacterium sp. NEAU 140]|uniref:hypothetical protein n=1 Tax=Methylobacterium sp. NEAU 140 TaxID=3064945 RepID=UPI0027375548|nr:hypothetical protein [Methylobacterium sp. NEAU 140]MDP4022383.1 hypothetical protein [Methylobacterium sp. NEAU 140]